MMNELTNIIPSLPEIKAFFLEQMKTNQFFQTAGFFGILGFVANYFRAVPAAIWERIERRIKFRTSIEETSELFNYFEVWLSKHKESSYRNVEAAIDITDDEGRQVRNEDYIWEKRNNELDNSKRTENILYKQYEDTFYLRRGFQYLHIKKGREKLENASQLKNAFINRFVITGWFAKKAIRELIDEILKYNLEVQEKMVDRPVKIYITNHYGDWTSVNDIHPKGIEHIFLENKDNFIKDIRQFLGAKVWYKDRGILYKRGYMLYGPPGNGKTSLSLAIAKEFKRNLYILDLSNMSNDKLNNAFNELTKKSILIIEDIDAFFDEKRKKKSKSKVNFSTLLNCLDGVFSQEDVITIFTTNHPERLDKALIRAGRIDMKLEITNPSIKMIEDYVTEFFELLSVSFENDKIPFNKKVPMSTIQDICISNKTNIDECLEEIESVLISEHKYKKEDYVDN